MSTNIFSNEEIIKYSGFNDLPSNKKYENLKSFLTNKIEEYKNDKKHLNFTDNRIYNHVQFYKFFDIKIDIVLEKISSNKYATMLKYKNNCIYKCTKNYESFFNCKILRRFKKNNIFSSLFLNNKLFNENLIIIDKSLNEYKDRPDMLINFNEVKFVVEFFERHHINNKNDPEFHAEKNRLRRIIDTNALNFAIVFNVEDLLDSNKFNFKFNSMYDRINELVNIADEQSYCTNGINKYIGDKKLSKLLYLSHLDKKKPFIDIDKINNIFIKFKNKKMEKKYFEKYKKFIEDVYNFNNKTIDNNNCDNIEQVDFLLEDDEFDDEFKDNIINEQVMIKEDFIRMYYIENKLTFEGFQYYISLVSEEYLLNINEKSKIINHHHRIFTGLIDGLHDKFNDMEQIEKKNKIIGI